MPLEGLALITSSMTKYETLGVAVNATADEVHRGYRRMAMLYHPDRHTEENRLEAEDAFRSISAAFQVLSDPAKREQYDRALASGHEYVDSTPVEGAVDLREILRSMEEYEDPRDTNVLTGKLAELDPIVSANLIREIGEHVVDAWPLTAAPPGVTIQGNFKAGAAVLTNVRLLLPFTSQWETKSGNVKTTHTAAYMVVCALYQTGRMELNEQDILNRTLQVRFVQQDRTIEFKTNRHNLARLLLVARRWGVPVQGTFVADRRRERKWALAPIRWIPVVAIAYLLVVCIGYFWLTEDGFSTAITDGVSTLYPIGLWVCIACALWSVYRLRLWVLTYMTKDLHEMLHIEMPSNGHPKVQTAP